MMSVMAILQQLSEFLCKIDHFLGRGLLHHNSREGQESHSQAGTPCQLPLLWCGAGREVRTHHGTGSPRTASGSTIGCSRSAAERGEWVGEGLAAVDGERDPVSRYADVIVGHPLNMVGGATGEHFAPGRPGRCAGADG